MKRKTVQNAASRAREKWSRSIARPDRSSLFPSRMGASKIRAFFPARRTFSTRTFSPWRRTPGGMSMMRGAEGAVTKRSATSPCPPSGVPLRAASSASAGRATNRAASAGDGMFGRVKEKRSHATPSLWDSVLSSPSGPISTQDQRGSSTAGIGAPIRSTIARPRRPVRATGGAASGPGRAAWAAAEAARAAAETRNRRRSAAESPRRAAILPFPPVVVLQRAHGPGVPPVGRDAEDSRLGRGDRGEIGDLVADGRLADVRVVALGRAPAGGVDDELDLAVLDGVDHVGPPLAVLQRGLGPHPGPGEELAGPRGRPEGEPELGE